MNAPNTKPGFPGRPVPGLAAARDFYETTSPGRSAAGISYQKMLAGIFRRLIPPGVSVLEIGCGDGLLLSMLSNRDVTGIDLSEKRLAIAREKAPHGKFFTGAGEEISLGRTFDYIIISDTLQVAVDVQRMFERALEHAHAGTRLVLNNYNALWRPLFDAATALGWRQPTPWENWLSTGDIENLFELAGWQVVTRQSHLLLPVNIPLLSNWLNRLVAPLAPWACATVFLTARPSVIRRVNTRTAAPKVTVLIPARNEAGNIRAAIERTPEMGGGTEIIFVEGGSKDDTWSAIHEAIASFPGRQIRAMRQTGRGKGNAVREGFAQATGDILMILDADLTVPPEDLPKFYDVLVSGRADFANGVRLVYPMEERAMRFLNLCANKFFGAAFSWLLGQRVKDTLCGTKVLWREDYEKLAAGRSYFGDFDPFGDFDLLFGAAKLNLKILDIPVRYKERTYGSTNIHRFRHGLLLFGMLFVAARRLKFI